MQRSRYISGRETPPHRLSVRSDEKIRQRCARRRRIRRLLSLLNVLTIRFGANFCSGGRNVTDPDSPPANTIFSRFRFFFANENFRKNDAVYDASLRCRRVGNNSRRPNVMRTRNVRGIDEDVGIQKYHISRVDFRNSSQDSVMRSGYSDMALRQSLRRSRIVRSSRRRSKTPYPSIVTKRTLSPIAAADSIPARTVTNGAARPVLRGTSRRPDAVPVIGAP